MLKREELLWNRNSAGQTHGQRKIVAGSDVSHVKVRVGVIAIERASLTPSSVKNVALK